jgi:hypothetical protein
VPLLLLLTGNPAASSAAGPFTFYTDGTQVAVGDVITVTFESSVVIPALGSFEYTYQIPDGAAYIPNSFKQNGISIADADGRLTISKTQVRLRLPLAPIGSTFFTLRLRVTGEIGQPIHHRAVLSGAYPTQVYRASPTRIEDETAILIAPDAKADASLSQLNPTWNFGVASYALLMHMFAQECDLIPRFLIHTFGDLHIYVNHVEGLKKQLTRSLLPLPSLWLAKKPFDDLKFENIGINNYDHHPFIKFEVAI